jgi:PAS domain S-box-containing protein
VDAGVANRGQTLKLRLDQSLRCVSSSPDLSEHFGMPAASLVGKYFPDLLVPAEAPTIIETFRGAIEEWAEAVIVASWVHTGGSGWIELNVVPVDAGAADAAMLEIKIRDVTHRVSEENRLRASLMAERSVNEIATRLVGWPDSDLDAALAHCLAEVVARFEGARARILLRGNESDSQLAGLLSDYGEEHPEVPDVLFELPVWLSSALPHDRRIEAMPVEAWSEASSNLPGALLDHFASEGICAYLLAPCQVDPVEVEVYLELCWDRPRGALETKESRFLMRVGVLLAGLIDRRRAVASTANQRGHAGLVENNTSLEDQDRFRVLVDQMRDSICEIAEDGRILYASPSYAELFGSTAESLVGSDPLRSVHQDDRRRVSQMFRPGARSRRQGTLVYRAQSMQGELLHLEATAREFKGQDDRPRVVVATRDVSERENVRYALERHVQMETLIAELSRFFIDVDIDEIRAGIESRLAGVAELADAQHSWMYSFSSNGEDVEFFDWWREEDDLRKPVAASQSIATFPYSTNLLMSGRVYQVTDVDALPDEAENERKDMRKRGVQSILGIPIMSKGRFVGFLGFESFDRETSWPEETIMLLRMVGEIFYSALHRRRAVEDFRQSQSQLLQSQKIEAVGTLAGGIAHDFNNHLAVMLANARFVRQEVEAESEVVAAIEDFERSADHCAQLTRSLLAFSRRTPVEIVPVEVAGLVEEVEDLVRPLLPSTIHFEMELMPDLGSVAVDRVQIQQVLVNLLVNARDAMPDGGIIRLDACRRPILSAEATAKELDEFRDYVVLSVRDVGQGMDAETQSRVFEPFFTTKDVGHGTGLGLAMAYGIVRQSEGAIAVESRPGQGSTFRIYLPGLAVANPKITK